jgi:hypothetical protein
VALFVLAERGRDKTSKAFLLVVLSFSVSFCLQRQKIETKKIK